MLSNHDLKVGGLKARRSAAGKWDLGCPLGFMGWQNVGEDQIPGRCDERERMRDSHENCESEDFESSSW